MEYDVFIHVERKKELANLPKSNYDAVATQSRRYVNQDPRAVRAFRARRLADPFR